MICGNCGQDARKVTVKFHPVREESCEHCADGGIHHDPAWMRHKPVPRWESHPNEYKKRTEADGSVLMEPTDENKADLEAQVTKMSEDDKQAIESRRNRQPKPIDMNKAISVAENFVKEYGEVWKQYEEANADYWNTAAEELKVQ